MRSALPAPGPGRPPAFATRFRTASGEAKPRAATGPANGFGLAIRTIDSFGGQLSATGQLGPRESRPHQPDYESAAIVPGASGTDPLPAAHPARPRPHSFGESAADRCRSGLEAAAENGS